MKKNYFKLILGFAFLLVFILDIDGQEKSKLTKQNVTEASKLIGLEFTESEKDSMLDELNDHLSNYIKIREIDIDNSIPPSLNFNPIPVGKKINHEYKDIVLSNPVKTAMPNDIEKLAYYSVRDLGELIKNRKITSVQLTIMYLERLKKYGKKLECVITLTEEVALKQAKQADKEISEGKYRGLLHGIPYGAKDLLAVKGYKTTWGAMPYKDQVIAENATVIKKLEEAGAVLVAKLTLGALAWGDVWFGGKTRNPWNLEQGSSGSSAGSASATSAGLVAFAIGTETWGSIVSPSTRCGTTGLRPTYGRVSRTGAMALCWSMDKIGPICRTVEDCAIVFNAIKGTDGIDQTLVDLPFNYDANEGMENIRVGYLKKLFEEDYDNKNADQKTLEKIREFGVELIEVELPDYPIEAMSFILSAEAASAFDILTRSGKDDLMVRQIKNAWPNVFRAARFISAVEYIQANRLRYKVIQEMENIFTKVDVYIAPSFGGNNLLLTNLTSHPCVVLPNGFDEKGSPVSISFIGDLYQESHILTLAKKYQDATDFHKQHPPLFK
jgi:Asp-tRNA(Asn)/Glu-tRNA(Gln) amidotransferase A subunit family amidase